MTEKSTHELLLDPSSWQALTPAVGNYVKPEVNAEFQRRAADLAQKYSQFENFPIQGFNTDLEALAKELGISMGLQSVSDPVEIHGEPVDGKVSVSASFGYQNAADDA